MLGEDDDGVRSAAGTSSVGHVGGGGASIGNLHRMHMHAN